MIRAEGEGSVVVVGLGGHGDEVGPGVEQHDFFLEDDGELAGGFLDPDFEVGAFFGFVFEEVLHGLAGGAHGEGEGSVGEVGFGEVGVERRGEVRLVLADDAVEGGEELGVGLDVECGVVGILDEAVDVEMGARVQDGEGDAEGGAVGVDDSGVVLSDGDGIGFFIIRHGWGPPSVGGCPTPGDAGGVLGFRC